MSIFGIFRKDREKVDTPKSEDEPEVTPGETLDHAIETLRERDLELQRRVTALEKEAGIYDLR